jgi:hypothetical protein
MRNVMIVSVLALAVAACGGNKAANTQNAAAPAANNQATSAPAYSQVANAQAPAAAAAVGITPQEVRAMVARDGANATVRTLNEGGTEAAPNRFAMVMRGVSSGEQAWLDIVPLIRPGTDGEAGEGLSIALGDALPRNAAGVLRILKTPDDVASACEPLAFEEGSAERTAHVQAAIAALEAVSDPALQQAKASCLATLRAALTAR